LTIQQLAHYLEEINIYRGKIPAEDVSLEVIRIALFQFAGVKEQPKGITKTDSLTKLQAKGFPVTKMTKEQVNKWSKAGYPDLNKWLRKNK